MRISFPSGPKIFRPYAPTESANSAHTPIGLTLVTVNETTLNDINRAGLGKNFESNGTILLNFSWTKGQQYNDIKEQIV